MHVDGLGGEFHVKAGGLKQPRAYFACKINGGFFQNRARFDLPNIQGLILLYDATNGVPLAVMESGTVTVLRTGAATAVAARHLARPGASVATLCGVGTQGTIQLRALHRVLPLRKVYAWSRDVARAEDFSRRMREELAIEVQPVTVLREATRTSDIIVTCTPARKWFLGREEVRPGTLVAAVGADSPDKQEIEPELLAQSGVVCDLIAQCAAVGDLHHAIERGLMSVRDVRAELGEVVAGTRPGRTSSDEMIVFDSTGTALQDVATAALVYEKAIASGAGQRFPFWGSPAA
jgi:ornithine cyclodeaminase/alanine dehydrogenase-like protein (mu-crystallin family)